MNFQAIRTVGFSLCVIVILACAGIVFTKFSDLNQAKESLRDSSEKLQKLKIEVAQIDKLMADYDKEKEEFSQYLFSDRNIPSFLDEISKIAADSGVSIVDMKAQSFRQVAVSDDFQAKRYGAGADKAPVPTEKEKRDQILTLSAMPIAISLKGQFKNFATFLERIQSNKQLVSIANMSIALGTYPELSCRFTLNIYSIKTLSELNL